ncbi:hypothetical protein BST39_29315, partial [Mycobacterium paraseoulense]
IQAYNSPPFCTQRRAEAIPLPADNLEQDLLFALLAQHLLRQASLTTTEGNCAPRLGTVVGKKASPPLADR